MLSDEAHHIYSPGGNATLKKWKEFIASPAYGFRYHVGLSGTCYVGNDYFSDVVHRYSIRDAINDRLGQGRVLRLEGRLEHRR